MLMTITYEGEKTQDLGYLLHKNPYTTQKFELNFGNAYVFYPEVSGGRTTAALLLDINSLDLTRGKEGADTAGLFDYINDRPYTANSFMSTAINRVFGTAMSGRCDERPELADTPIKLTACVYMLNCSDDELAHKIFEPLGYEVKTERGLLDERFPEWGESPYINLTISGTVRLSELLDHLYVLIPVFDGKKHYYIDDSEIDKIFDHGGEWLKNHPESSFILLNGFNKIRSITRNAFSRLYDDPQVEMSPGYSYIPKYNRLRDLRLDAVRDAIIASGANKVLDIGCGEGQLENRLIKEPQITRITAADVSPREIEIARSQTHYHGMMKEQHNRICFIQASAIYRDKRFEGHDCCCLIEVIEHMDAAKIPLMERVVFEFTGAKTVIVTTPNKEYNINFSFIPEGNLRHTDHRFEWTREEFRSWTRHICEKFGYTVKISGIGKNDENYGAPTQMGVFTKCV